MRSTSTHIVICCVVRIHTAAFYNHPRVTHGRHVTATTHPWPTPPPTRDSLKAALQPSPPAHASLFRTKVLVVAEQHAQHGPAQQRPHHCGAQEAPPGAHHPVQPVGGDDEGQDGGQVEQAEGGRAQAVTVSGVLEGRGGAGVRSESLISSVLGVGGQEQGLWF